jgi:hypothetical protein
VGFSLSVASQNQQREVGVGHTSRSSSLLGVEASLARVSQSALKTGGGATTDDARDTSKLKIDGSMRQAESDPATLALSFSFY